MSDLHIGSVFSGLLCSSWEEADHGGGGGGVLVGVQISASLLRALQSQAYEVLGETRD